MAVVNVLPNGFLVITLSPREGVMLNDQILEPGDYPWQFTESQMVAVEVKAQIKAAVQNMQAQHTNMLSNMTAEKMLQEEEERRQREEQERQQ